MNVNVVSITEAEPRYAGAPVRPISLPLLNRPQQHVDFLCDAIKVLYLATAENRGPISTFRASRGIV